MCALCVVCLFGVYLCVVCVWGRACVICMCVVCMLYMRVHSMRCVSVWCVSVCGVWWGGVCVSYVYILCVRARAVVCFMVYVYHLCTVISHSYIFPPTHIRQSQAIQNSHPNSKKLNLKSTK